MTTHAELPDAGANTHHQIDVQLAVLNAYIPTIQADLDVQMDNIRLLQNMADHLRAEIETAKSHPHPAIQDELNTLAAQLAALQAEIHNLSAQLQALATSPQLLTPNSQPLTHAELPDVGLASHTAIDLQLPATNEKEALAGSPGTPSTSNPYLTADHVDNAETVSGQWDFTNNLTTFGPSAAWRIGEEVLNLDFTGTDYDTVAECNVVGLRFSDTDTPFPDTFRFSVSGTWTHSTGNGWQPASSTADEGPALIIPLCRAANWELELVINYAPTNVLHMMTLDFGYISNSNHVGACATIADAWATSSQIRASLNTNDGDDTYTAQYTGATLASTGERTYKFRCKNGCVSVWDEQDDAWHNYTGRQNAGLAYTAAWAFIQVRKYSSQDLCTIYLKSLILTYLL